jgi:hypothetical protein
LAPPIARCPISPKPTLPICQASRLSLDRSDGDAKSRRRFPVSDLGSRRGSNVDSQSVRRGTSGRSEIHNMNFTRPL